MICDYFKVFIVTKTSDLHAPDRISGTGCEPACLGNFDQLLLKCGTCTVLQKMISSNYLW